MRRQHDRQVIALVCIVNDKANHYRRDNRFFSAEVTRRMHHQLKLTTDG